MKKEKIKRREKSKEKNGSNTCSQPSSLYRRYLTRFLLLFLQVQERERVPRDLRSIIRSSSLGFTNQAIRATTSFSFLERIFVWKKKKLGRVSKEFVYTRDEIMNEPIDVSINYGYQ